MTKTDLPLRYRSLDLWRGIACLSVIVYHAAMTDHGWVGAITEPLRHGVTIFFVISGYCIAAASSRQQGLNQYFLSRFRRIFPPYWIFLLGTIIVATVLFIFDIEDLFTDSIAVPRVDQARLIIPLPWDLNIWQWAGNLSLTEMWRHHMVWRGGQRFFVGHAWTLCYEEQFYAVMGALMFLSRRYQAIGVVLVSMAVVMVAPHAADGFFFDGRWLVFAGGTSVFYWRNHSPWFTVPSIALLTAVTIFLIPSWDIRLSITIGGVFAGLLFVLRLWDETLMKSKWTNPIYACGIRCYSIYLVHLPVTKLISRVFMTGEGWFTLLVTVPSSVAISLGIAWLFHACVERRFMNPAQAKAHKTVPNYSVPGSQREEPLRGTA